MAVGEGRFVLYSRIEPPLEAGDYRFTASQSLTATGHTASQLPVADLPTHVTVRSPRYALPPDQVLSTYPPAGSEGSYGARLPQVVIRRRTLPWERSVQAGVPRSTPWLALVLVAEGEAELKLNRPVAECVTPGRTLPGKADSELGNYLAIRRSVVHRVFPTRLDVPLLAHAREVDIHDTELMMGDDDGFLAVVIANRLPLSGRDEHGAEIPAKYLACLVNLEGQFTELLERSPARAPATAFPVASATVKANLVEWDHARMGHTATSPAAPPAGFGPAPYAPGSTWVATGERRGVSDVYTEMARDFSHATVAGFVAGDTVALDPTLHFPVLLHWSFTSYGDVTFRSLMEGLDSGLLGTTTPAQRVEVVETGHLGLDHRTRRGDQVRSWYRGPCLAHPTTGERLPLAHAADQLRIIVPDGREDISLAAAFEIGRLLALSRPSMVAALLRWRQAGYQAARRKAVWDELAPFVTEVVGDHVLDPWLGVHLGRGLARAVTVRPEELLGAPRPLATPGRLLALDGTPEQVLAQGFGLPAGVFRGSPSQVLSRLRDSEVILAREPGLKLEALASRLNQVVDRLVADVRRPVDEPRLPGGTRPRPAEPRLPGQPRPPEQPRFPDEGDRR
ncbi:MAG TPA: hypothetical protein VFM54_07750 [Micromonosporaceae bacterium]|nr:hypothetical protein [Micromonosporaceae bacterium]